MNGRIGVPAGGFPEPFRTRVLRGEKPSVPDGKRPGETIPAPDFEAEAKKLTERTGVPFIEDFDQIEDSETQNYFHYNDLISQALYPDVHRAFQSHLSKYSDTSMIPTPFFFAGMTVGEQVDYKNVAGRDRYIKLSAIGHVQEDGHRRVFFEVNGLQNSFDILDRTDAGVSLADKREKADPSNDGHIACSMKGLVVDVLKAEGDLVEEGEPIAVLSAMKMESVISAPKSGRITKCLVL